MALYKYVLISLSSSLLLLSTVSAQTKLKIEPYVFKTFKNKQGEVKTVEAEMGTLMVPENRTKAGSKKIALKFVRFKSTNPRPGSPIIYLAGGPGGSGFYTAKGTRFPLFMKMREVADVIAFDQRGTGLSDKLPQLKDYWMYPMDQPLEQNKVSKVIKAYSQKAAKQWKEMGVDLAAYNTNESADDLNDLRKALGARKMSLWGISYGTHLAIATIKRHEKYIDKVILAGIEASDHTVKLPSNSQKLLEKIDQLIKVDPEAKKAFPDFLGDIEKLLAKLEKQPVMVETIHPLSKQAMKVAMGKLEAQILLAQTLRGPRSFRKTPQMVKNMLAGDFSAASRQIVYTHGGGLRAMSGAMDVASGISKKRWKQVQRERKNTLLAGAINFPYMAVKAGLGVPDLGAKFRTPLKSKLPVLCISGTLDGRTPVSNAEELLEGLPKGKHLVIDGAGHSDPLFLSSPRIAEVMLDYMKGKKIKNETIRLKPVKFWIQKGKTKKQR